MAGITQDSTGIVVLGASGRVGRMICDLGPLMCPDLTDGRRPRILPVVRHPARAGQVQWAPGHPLPSPLRGNAIIAAWGVTTATDVGHAANVQLAHDAVALARTIGARRVVHCSSAAVYGPPPDPEKGVPETTPPAPVTPYGQSKLDMERAISAGDSFVESVFLRIGNVAGADRLAESGRSGVMLALDQFTDGRGPRRSYIGPKALVQVMLWAALAQGVPRILNVAAPHPIGMEDLARAMGWPMMWRPAPDTALSQITLDTHLLQSLCPLPANASDPETIAAELHAGGWHR